MKGKSKYIVPLLLAGVTTGSGVVSTVDFQQQVEVRADVQSTDTQVAGAELRLIGGFEKDIYNVGVDTITMPTVKCYMENGSGVVEEKVDATIVYKVFKGDKEPLYTFKSGDAEADSFVPKYTGAYNVVISAEVDGVVVTEMKGITVMVQKTEATINLPVNSNNVIPAQIPAGNVKGLTIPAPTVTIGDSEEETSAEEAGLKVFLISPDASLDDPKIPLGDQDGKPVNGVYTVSKDQIAVPGTYQIRYEYRDSTTGAIVSKLETNFQVVDGLKAPTDLFIKFKGGAPSTGNVNTEVTLPKVTVLPTQTATDGINAHVEITVSRINGNGDVVETCPVNYDNYTFTPKTEGKYIVEYKADLYSIYEGVDSEPITLGTNIIISDKANPVVRATYGYKVENGVVTGVDTVGTNDNETYDKNFVAEDTQETREEVLKDRRVDVPSIVVRNQPIEGSTGKKAVFYLPAIYATDNKGYEGLTFTREIVSSKLPTKLVYDETTGYSAGDVVKVELEKDGDYEIRYKVTDANGNMSKMNCPLVVTNEAGVADAETSIKLGIALKSITDRETLKFSAPVIKDTYDSYLDTTIEYDILAGATVLETIKLDETNSDGKYEINLKTLLATKKEGSEDLKYADADAIKVRVTAKNDYSETPAKEEKIVKIVRTTNDKATAEMQVVKYDVSESYKHMEDHDKWGWDDDADNTVTSANWNTALFELNNYNKVLMEVDESESIYGINKFGFATKNAGGDVFTSSSTTNPIKLSPFDQGNNALSLPAVKFNDTDENLRITLTITDRDGNTVSKESYERIEKTPVMSGKDIVSWDYVVYNASFRMSSYGMHTITYRAEDSAGNVVVKSFGVVINDKTAPTIVIDDEDKYGVDIEVGDFFEVPLGTLVKDNDDNIGGEVNWDVTCSTGAYCEVSSTGFTPLTEGTFYIKYKGKDDADNSQTLEDNTLFFVTAKDTTAPVLNDDSSYILPATKAWKADANGEVEVTIPKMYATDPIRNEAVKVDVTVETPNGKSVTIEDYADADKSDRQYFMASAQGVYKITYTATDDAGNKTSYPMEIALGDCEAPTIKWQDEENDIPKEMKLNDVFELKLSHLTITDKVTTDANYLQDKMTITMVKPGGATASNEGSAKSYKWTLSETGTYVLKITVRDEAGMKETYEYEINVTAEEVEEDKISSKVGIALAVVSVVILGGVIVYFVVTSRKKAPAKPKKANKKD